ncbi:MAG: hypothetical protein V3V33_11830 [Candidatus Lokiarchaeia archaeon]
MKNISLLIFLLSFISSQYAFSQTNYLEKSSTKNSIKQDEKYFEIEYEEANNYFTHSMNPWDKGTSTRKGLIWANSATFLKVDTLYLQSGAAYYSKTEFHHNKLYTIPYGSEELKSISKSELKNYYVKTLAYSPALVLEYFNKQDFKDLMVKSENNKNITFSLHIGDYYVSVQIDKESYFVNRISTLSANEEDDQFYGFGDIEDVYIYKNYVQVENRFAPTQIIKNELNGQLSDTINVKNLKITKKTQDIIPDPKDYSIQEDVIEKPDISVEHYSENIYLINLHHSGTRSLLVEFNDFLLVAEAPLNSRYGEQLLAEVRKIHPLKPIKYFVFGHFHPHYTGGIRPFINEGAKVICVKEDEEYIKHIVDAKHTLKPDSLAINPKEVQFENIYQAKTITDGKFYMSIYHIGKKSNHTNDYLIFYFPKEKMIFQDDLVWIEKDTNKSNISDLTKGFYQAVKDLNLDVEEVVQNWSIFDRNNKMIFKFKDIENIFEND